MPTPLTIGFSRTLSITFTLSRIKISRRLRGSLTLGLLIGTYDNFTYGDPAGFLSNINNHIPTARENKLIFIEGTGHTYQRKEQETADRILELLRGWE